jgi:hypothetical protein
MGPDEEIVDTIATSEIVEAPASAPAESAAPAAEPAKPVSVHDSVRAAFDKLTDGETPADNKAAETAPRQPRDPGGRFAAKPKNGDPAAAAAAAQPRSEPRPTDSKAAPAAPAAPAGPPPGWSVTSKAAWDQLPQHIRDDIAKREGEVAQGLAALRDFKDVKPYAEMAQKSGTTLSAALQRYTTMEGMLRRDPAQGLMAIAQSVGLSQAQAAQLFAQLATRLGARPTNGLPSNGGQPSTSGSDQNDPLAEVLGPILEQRLGPLAQKLGTLESHLTQQQRADQNARAESVAQAIERFAANPAHRYFPELEETISRLFESGMVQRTADAVADLKTAYDMAARLHPEVHETLVSERLKTRADEAKAKAAAAQRAAVSLNGHPAGGAAAPPRTAAGLSARDSVRAVYQQLSAGV